MGSKPAGFLALYQDKNTEANLPELQAQKHTDFRVIDKNQILVQKKVWYTQRHCSESDKGEGGTIVRLSVAIQLGILASLVLGQSARMRQKEHAPLHGWGIGEIVQTG
ncbi:UNKNOWN [Stylonychia lemnae]|uniref:Uncharacterized protein n=1 Tax=Stylonychia lemnae TaxID=5949 RepID=A0A078A527_STYLE|nr:UNKNOWN [Stylonychia lemnae]|eukprot:CDW76969.1 UNKNOWN [Stylonychia lemnae]